MRFNYQTAALRICVDGEGFNGRIVGQRVYSPIQFSDINDFVTQVDALLDAQNFPRAFQQIRSFTGKEQPDVPAALSPEQLSLAEEVAGQNGRRATFQLLIRSRQNASWQGYIDWLDGQNPQSFDSTLEFMKLLCDGLNL